MDQLVFLEADQREDFEAGRYPRLLLPIDDDDGRPGRPVDLAAATADAVTRMVGGRSRGFRCLAVSAVHEDGITWAAATAAQAVAESPLRPELIAVRGRAAAGAVPEILRILPRRAVASAARRSGVTASFRLLSPWATVAVLAGAVLAGAAVTLLTTWNKAATGTAAVGTAVLLAVAGIIGQQLAAWWKLDPGRPLLSKLAEEVHRQAGTDSYRAFVEQLAAQLADRPALRCVVVDDFSGLDAPTRDVLERYLRGHTSAHRPELWVVFDGHDPQDPGYFAQLVVTAKRQQHRARAGGYAAAGAGLRRARLYEMAELDPQQRFALARDVGMPERAGFRRVKSIVAPSADSLSTLFDEYVPADTATRDPRRFGAFQLLYALSVDAATGGSVTWSLPWLVSTLSSDRVRSHVLRTLLPGEALTRSNLTGRLTRLRQVFAPVVTTEAGGAELTLRVDAEVGNLLGRQWATRGLADVELVHLFWAICWYDDKRRDRDVFFVNKIATHLGRVSPPAAYAAQLGADLGAVTAVVFDALVTTAEKCLRLSLLRHVPRLVELAYLTLQEDDALPEAGRQRLRRLVRDAYSILGDDRLVTVLLDLGTPGEPEPGLDRAGIADSLTALFLESVDTRRNRSAVAAMARDGRMRGLPAYAELRGAWLALSLQPFLNPSTTLLTAAARLARGSAGALARSAVDAVEQAIEGGRPCASGDVVTLCLGMWCWAWSGDDSRLPGHDDDPDGTEADAKAITDALESTYLVAGELVRERFAAGGAADVDFALDCLSEELLAVTAAATLFVLQRWPSAAVTPVEARLEEVLRDTLEDLRLAPVDARDEAVIRTDTVRLLEERIALLQAIWKRLGFAQMAADLNVRTAQLGLFQDRDEASVSSSLAENLQRPGLLGLAANAAFAERVINTRELAAELMVHSARAALGANLGEALCAQLCLLALSLSHCYESDARDLMAYLLAPGHADPIFTRLHFQLSAAPDRDFQHLALWLLNVATHPGVDSEAVTEAIRDRASTATEPACRARIADLLDVFACEQSRKRGTPIDVDAVLDSWAPRRESPQYPRLLLILLQADRAAAGDRLLGEASYTVENYRRYLSFSGIVMLSSHLVGRLGTAAGPAGSAVVGALKSTHEWFEGMLQVDMNIRILEQLKRHDPDNRRRHQAHIEHWLKVQLEIDEQRKLPSLMQEGQWALLFLDYCYLFGSYGLAIDGSAPAEAAGYDAGRLAALRDQVLRSTPVPLHRDGDQVAVSYEFVRNARLLFENELRDDPALDEARADYDDAAKRAVNDLLALLAELSSVPASIKTILQRHRKLVEERLFGAPSLLTVD